MTPITQYKKVELEVSVAANCAGVLKPLAAFSLFRQPVTQSLCFCRKCCKVMYKVHVRYPSTHHRPDWTSYLGVCSECGGDDTVLFHNFWGHYLLSAIEELEEWPKALFDYEVTAATTYRNDWDEIPHDYTGYHQ